MRCPPKPGSSSRPCSSVRETTHTPIFLPSPLQCLPVTSSQKLYLSFQACQSLAPYQFLQLLPGIVIWFWKERRQYWLSGSVDASLGGMEEAILNWPILPHSSQCKPSESHFWISWWSTGVWRRSLRLGGGLVTWQGQFEGASSLDLRLAWVGAFPGCKVVTEGGGEFWGQTDGSGTRAVRRNKDFELGGKEHCYRSCCHMRLAVCFPLQEGAKWKWGSI